MTSRPYMTQLPINIMITPQIEAFLTVHYQGPRRDPREDQGNWGVY